MGTELQPLQVCYLPWAGLEQAVTVGPVRFVPMMEWLQSVTDQDVVRFWTRYARCHVGLDGKPVDTLVVAVHAKATFGWMTRRQIIEIERASLALAFAYLAGGCCARALPANRGAGSIPIATSDQFVLFTKSFRPNDRFATIKAGALSSMWSLTSLRLQRPSHVAGTCVEAPDRMLLAGLGRLVRAGPRHRFANQVWSALEWTRMAFAGGDEVADETRIVLMMTAFECLLARLKAPTKRGGEVKEAFEAFVAQHLTFKKLRTATITMFKSKKKRVMPISSAWFYAAFGARGAVVHGDRLHARQGAYRGHQHLLLAVLFMRISVKAMLADAALLPSAHLRSRRTLFEYLAGQPETRRVALLNDFRHDDLRRLYQALGWLRRPPGRQRPKPQRRIVWT